MQVFGGLLCLGSAVKHNLKAFHSHISLIIHLHTVYVLSIPIHLKIWLP